VQNGATVKRSNSNVTSPNGTRHRETIAQENIFGRSCIFFPGLIVCVEHADGKNFVRYQMREGSGITPFRSVRLKCLGFCDKLSV
jgi:hypothetical protein